MRKILFVFSFMLVLCNCYGQRGVEISIQQDARLLFFGDKKGNAPLTLNLLSKIEASVYKLNKSHVSTYLSAEYADLVGKNYKRYALGLGYVFKNVYRRIGAGAYVDFGKIYREKEGFYSHSISGELNYKISNRLKFICTQQLTYRKDLKVLYNSKKGYIISGFIGLKYRI
ncbi:hypothetical protein CW731_00240 [Polaribacter sp. ALD11]|uniref:hypothetical protein n=1 Tax=Polaribacter sp. ALD11 TaxID=2058137 RepID=UPI000C318B72|nr:hypothetical protein [Polaribacter sp. ALD11]AUC83810.1 hypothetical protein CW731_00240 [Polaribacter sp. ALD11]